MGLPLSMNSFFFQRKEKGLRSVFFWFEMIQPKVYVGETETSELYDRDFIVNQFKKERHPNYLCSICGHYLVENSKKNCVKLEQFTLEMGMKMNFYCCRKQAQTMDDYSLSERNMAMQITVREVEIPESFRKQGMFSRFVQYLLEEEKLAVQLESIQPQWLKERLEKSPLWIRQTPPAENLKMMWNPNYVRFETNKPFTLF